MGIETPPDVEESTEPPICACTESIAHVNPAGLSFEPCDASEKHTPTPASHICPAGTDQRTSFEHLERHENQASNSHLWEPEEAADFLQTHLQYVVAKT